MYEKKCCGIMCSSPGSFVDVVEQKYPCVICVTVQLVRSKVLLTEESFIDGLPVVPMWTMIQAAAAVLSWSSGSSSRRLSSRSLDKRGNEENMQSPGLLCIRNGQGANSMRNSAKCLVLQGFQNAVSPASADFIRKAPKSPENTAFPGLFLMLKLGSFCPDPFSRRVGTTYILVPLRHAPRVLPAA